MGWPSWLLLGLLAIGALILSALHLIRFRYHFAYAFPQTAESAVSLSFLGWKREFRLREGKTGGEKEADEASAPADNGGETASPAPMGAGGTRPGAPGPRPGQEGFLAVPFRARMSTWQGRLKSAGVKWALDLPVWGHLGAYGLRTGLRALRLVGPTLERLHLASHDVLNLGRFAAFWSSLSGLAPFLASPVEYRFAQPFALRFRISGGCTGLGFLLFALALVLSLPWLRLLRRFRHCWRNPRLNRWQRRVVAAI